VTFFGQGLKQAWQLIWHHDPYLWNLVDVTLKVAGLSTLIAVAIGLPMAMLIALGRFPGRRVLMVLANAGLGLPPVVVGVVLALLMFPASPLGRFHLLFTLKGVYVAQTVLALPVIVALSISALTEVSSALLSQARGLGASRAQVAALAAREARIGILAAIIAAVGSGLAEVGAVVLVGGNVQGDDQTLASAALQEIEAAHFANGMAIAILLLGLILIVTALLTLLQFSGASRRVGRSS
jgi:tungstate transport system permease protein